MPKSFVLNQNDLSADIQNNSSNNLNQSINSAQSSGSNSVMVTNLNPKNSNLNLSALDSLANLANLSSINLDPNQLKQLQESMQQIQNAGKSQSTIETKDHVENNNVPMDDIDDVQIGRAHV